jgi:hypothetical protein
MNSKGEGNFKKVNDLQKHPLSLYKTPTFEIRAGLFCASGTNIFAF